jgi:hypothetical protein
MHASRLPSEPPLRTPLPPSTGTPFAPSLPWTGAAAPWRTEPDRASLAHPGSLNPERLGSARRHRQGVPRSLRDRRRASEAMKRPALHYW